VDATEGLAGTDDLDGGHARNRGGYLLLRYVLLVALFTHLAPPTGPAAAQALSLFCAPEAVPFPVPALGCPDGLAGPWGCRSCPTCGAGRGLALNMSRSRSGLGSDCRRALFRGFLEPPGHVKPGRVPWTISIRAIGSGPRRCWTGKATAPKPYIPTIPWSSG
jgi:hypothetical protein